MIKSHLLNKFLLTLTITGLLFFSCKSDEELDEVQPSINCPPDINQTVGVFSGGEIVNYTEPVGTDNLTDATTTQVAGLGSGEVFPVGTTTNTYRVKDAAGNVSECSFDVILTRENPSDDMPYFVEVNPTPNGSTWSQLEYMSDEFDDESIDDTKWRLTSSGNWIGRPPGLFLSENVSEGDGNLKIKATKLAQDQTVNGDLFTHGGGYVEGLHPANIGLYLECRMKANKTFMSSTFWLNNKRNEASGCDKRVTEIDIQECVGTLTGTSDLASRGWDKIMHSNTHSRNTNCPETPTGSSPEWADVGENVADNYHVYGAWWKSESEIVCYLDGKEVHTLTPVTDFNLNTYLRLVVETYDWNPTPADGGMNFTEPERTTFYDWVRVWQLN
ncbi:MAG: HYR domain-containing protein [Bacteroidota bacterium]